MNKIKTYSEKQLKILTWWQQTSPYKDYNGIIADGAIRSGKSYSMSVGFLLWAITEYTGMQFGMSGKTVSSFERNVLFHLYPFLKARGFRYIYKDNILTVIAKINGKIHTNYFVISGGRDERSYTLIQGMTAAGWYFDEVALMPESFVNQAVGRCSVEGSKLWFNCNPDKPTHYFNKEWIKKADKKQLLHIHFEMNDNPGLSKKKIEQYKMQFTGVFYLRYIRGLWVLADGVIYDMVLKDNYYDDLPLQLKWDATKYLTIDYGTTNPFACYLIYDNWDIAYVEQEYYYNSKEHDGKQKTDKEYADDVEKIIAALPYPIEKVILDPSAASFRAELKTRGIMVKDADNSVLEGIKITSSALYQKKLKINHNCEKLIEELGGYVWDVKAIERGVEQPVKVNDHGCDAIRYFVYTVMKKRIMGRL